MTSVSVVGTGAMGGRIARRLLDAGHQVLVWNRTESRYRELVELGAVPVPSPAEAARRSDVVLTMVADPEALEAVTRSPDGLAAGVATTTTFIEMSTVGPAAVARLAGMLPDGTALLDAPVLGSISEAASGSLRIFVGGPDALFQRWEPLLSVFGSPIHVGPLDAGAAAKLVANLALFGVLGTLGESLALADALGLDRGVAFEVLGATPLAAQAERRRPSIESGSYPPRFALRLARKDAALILGAAVQAGVELPVAEAAHRWLTEAEGEGPGDRDYSAVLAEILHRSRRGPAGAITPGGMPRYAGLIIDLDGVVWLEGHEIPGAAQAIATLRDQGTRVVFLTNDPKSSREELAGRLTGLGIPAGPADVLTSAAATARLLSSSPGFVGRAAFVVGAEALHQEFERAGFDLVSEDQAERAAAVVVGGHEGFGYAELQAATTAVLHGAKLFATGRDALVPGPERPSPGTGAIVAAIEAATGVAATVVGKPEPFVFQIARDMLADREPVAVVGDTLSSDILGAKRAGLDAILVLTGTSTERDLDRAGVRPDHVLSSLAELARGEG